MTATETRADERLDLGSTLHGDDPVLFDPWERTRHGLPEIIAVTGDSGAGQSRLAIALSKRRRLPAVTVADRHGRPTASVFGIVPPSELGDLAQDAAGRGDPLLVMARDASALNGVTDLVGAVFAFRCADRAVACEALAAAGSPLFGPRLVLLGSLSTGACMFRPRTGRILLMQVPRPRLDHRPFTTDPSTSVSLH